METKAKGLTVLVIMTALCALVASASAPPTPFMIYGYVSYENGGACNNPTVNINNTNTSNNWSATTNESYNYYQLMLANGTDVNASEVLRFNVTSPTGNQSNITEHTVILGEVNNGGLFNFNISLEALIHDINVSTDYTGTVDGIKIIKEGTAIPADQNLTIGVEYQIRSRIVNDGDFNETVNVTIKVTNESGITVFQESFPKTVDVDDHKDAYRTWDTSGLTPGKYNITVNASIPVDDDWSNNERTRQVTLVSPAAPAITNWYNNKTKNNSTAIAINESECVFFNATADQPIDVWSWFVNGTNQSHNFDNFSYCNWTVNGTYYVKVNGTNTNGTSNTTTWTVTVNDITPPAKVTGLKNDTPTANTVNLTWNASTAPDFTKYSIYKDGVLLDNTTSTYYNVTGLNASTTYYFNVSAWDDNNNEGEWSDGVTITTAAYPAPIITDWYNNKTEDNSTAITINESECVFFNASANQPIDVWSWFVDGTNQSHNFDNFSYCDWTVNGTYYVDVNGTNANGTSDTVNWTVTVKDITPPASITNLHNVTYEQTYINWTWSDPGEADFSHAMVYLNGSFQGNVSKGMQFYNATGLTPNTEYTISTHTVDTAGNVNQTWVNHTANTAPTLDTTPPASITNLAYTNGTTWINWTWTNPPDTDFNYTVVYLNGTWKVNTSLPFYNATGLNPDTEYTLSTHTVDKVGNINETWVNGTAKALSVNTAPWWDTIPNQTIDEDTNLTSNLSEYVHDNETAAENLTLSIVQWDETNFSQCEINETQYLIAQPKPNWFGLSSGFLVNATDEGHLSNISNAFYVNVTPVNDAPQIAPIANQTHRVCDSWNVTINITDVDTVITKDMVTTNDPGNVTVYNVTTLTLNYTLVVTNKPVTVTVNDSQLNDSTRFYVTTYVVSPPAIADWYNNKTKNNATEITINESECVFFNATADQPIDVWSWFVNGTNQSHNFDNFSYCDWTVNGTYPVEANGKNPNGTSNTVNWTVTVEDITAPAKVQNLMNGTPTDTAVDLWWTPNTEPDLVGYCIYKNDNLLDSVLKTQTYYNVIGLSPSTTYEFNVSAYDDNDLEGENATVIVTTASYPAPAIIDWYNNKTGNNSTVITINESECVFFNATADQAIDVWGWFVNGTIQSHNFDNFSYCNWTVNGTYYVEVNARNANGTSNAVNWTVTVNDITPPASVSNLHNVTYAQTYINWTWDDPADNDFSHVMVYMGGDFKDNVTKGMQYYNAPGFDLYTEHTISTRTVDTSGNVNQSWVNHTARTAPDTTPPEVFDYAPTGTNVPVTTNVTATFSEAVNESTLNNETIIVKTSTGIRVEGIITYDSDNFTATFDPSSNLEYCETYNVTITTGVQDIAGNNMSSNITWNFTTWKPDLVISGQWVNWPQNCTICYNITNIGNGTVLAGHNTTLYVDGNEPAHDEVPVELAPNESYIGCFNYIWIFTPPQDNITVCADNNKTVTESNESNNCMNRTYKCGDVDEDGDRDNFDVGVLWHDAYRTPTNGWAEDVDGNGYVTIWDMSLLWQAYKRGGASWEPINCYCTEMGG